MMALYVRALVFSPPAKAEPYSHSYREYECQLQRMMLAGRRGAAEWGVKRWCH